MAAWTTLNTDNLLQGEPLVEQETLAFYENPTAIAEGASGAPRIWLPALERLEPGPQIRSRNDATVSITGATPETLLEFGFMQHGTVRVRADFRSADGAAVARLAFQRVRNFVPTDVEVRTTTNTSFQTITEDIDVIPGDTIRIVCSKNSGAVNDVQARNARIQTNGQDLWPGPLDVRLEGNRAAP